MASPAPPNTGTATTERKKRIPLFTPFIDFFVAPLVPEIVSSTGVSSAPKPRRRRDFHLLSNTLSVMDAIQTIVWTQQPAASSVAVPNVSILGTGIT